MENIAIVVLWSLVVTAGILVGGSIYETVVVNPLWAGAPPTSVTSWPYGSIQAPFFRVATPGWALLSVAVFALSFAMPQAARPWARAAGIIGVVVMIWTVTYFIPRVVATEGNRGAGLTPEEITRMTHEFVRWGYLRTVIAAGGWLVALRALILASR
jgi:hypothetical protein